MREILFRGKRTNNEEWIEGAYSPYNWNFFGEREEKPQIIIISDDKNIDGLWCGVIPETVGRFTGYCDKNMRKAFAGDILSHCGGLDYGVIRYGEYSNPFSLGQHIGFYVEWVYGEDKDELRNDLGYWLKAGTAEIAGNIHDNPELMPG